MNVSQKSLLGEAFGHLWGQLDKETKSHSIRVAKLARDFVRDCNICLKEKPNPSSLFAAGLWHDIGKLFISREILDFPGKLSRENYAVVQRHTVLGASLSRYWNNNKTITMVVKHHHERYDGQGYPNNILSKQLPVEVRIINVCDSFDAMVHRRVYKSAMPETEALKEIMNQAGKQFDPFLSLLFVSWREKVANKIGTKEGKTHGTKKGVRQCGKV